MTLSKFKVIKTWSENALTAIMDEADAEFKSVECEKRAKREAFNIINKRWMHDDLRTLDIRIMKMLVDNELLVGY